MRSPAMHALFLLLFILTGCNPLKQEVAKTEIDPNFHPGQGPLPDASQEPATQAVLSGQSILVATDTCSLALVLTTQDDSSTMAPVSSSKNFALSGGGSGTFYSSPTCFPGSEITSTTITAGTGLARIYYKNSLPETLTLEVDDGPGGFSAAVHSLTVIPGALGQLSISGPIALSSLSTCSAAYTVSTKDNVGNSVPVAFPLLVSLTGGGHGTFYSDQNCTGGNEITSLTLAAGTSSQMLHYKNTTAESLSFMADFMGLTTGVLAITVDPGPGALLEISGAPFVSATSACSSAYSVILEDAFGNSTTTGANLSLTLGGAGTGNFYSDSACTGGNEVNSLILPGRSSSGAIYYRNTSTGVTTFTASASGLTQGSLPITINPSSPVQIDLAGPTTLPATSSCSSAFTVTTRDGSSNPSAVLNTTVLTLSGTGSGGFYADSSCTPGNEITSLTLAGGTSSGNVYYKNTTAQALTLSADDGPSGLTAGTHSLTVTPGVPFQLLLQGPTSLSAGTCSSAYTLALKDIFSNSVNAASNTPISLTSIGGGTFHSSSNCSAGTATTTTTITAGTSSKPIYFKNSAAGTLTLEADDGPGGLTAGTTSLMVTPGAPTRLILSGPSSLSATDACSSAYTVASQDSLGNPSTVTSTVSIVLTGGGAGTFFSDASCTIGNELTTLDFSAGAGSGNFYYKSSSSGGLTFTASDGTAGLSSGTWPVTVNPGNPTVLKLSGPTIMLATSPCSSAYTVTTEDSAGNPSNVSSPTTLNLSGAGNGTFYSDSSCTGGNEVTALTMLTGANAKIFYYKNATTEGLTLNAASPGFTGGSLNLTVSAGAPALLTLSGGATHVATSSCSGAYAVSVKDSVGNASALPSTITVTLGGAGSGTFYLDSACSNGNEITSLTMGAGTSAKTFHYKNTTVQGLILSASSGGLSTGTRNVVVTPGARAPSPSQVPPPSPLRVPAVRPIP